MAAETAPAEPALFDEPVMDAPAAEPAWVFEQTATAAAAQVAAVQPSLLDEDLEPVKLEPMGAETHSFHDPEAVDEEPLFPVMHHEERRPQKGRLAQPVRRRPAPLRDAGLARSPRTRP